ncbi:hypothetical protein LF1_13490 [Rubripirellula obstinata]|uniref:Secreted protein n=1 Tax=Rubripirellula obstinata TaxID=406547 RepID=A0A5B1CFX6_9BACT|nr:hypothetical protein LF1_13490 [Rubripirellula obstinata]
MYSSCLCRFSICLGVAVLFGVTAVPADAANRNSSWGWAKPLHEKPGSLLYTTNRARKGPSATRYRSNRQPVYYTVPRSSTIHGRVSQPQYRPRFFRGFRR